MTTELTTHTMDREKVELIKQTVAKGATDLELDLFLHACKRTGLDPLMKQIYAIKRWSAADQRETLTFQTGIDGYRLIADRTGCYAGSDEPVYVVSPSKLPEVASVTVYKLIGGVRCPFTASARWEEYHQKNRVGQLTAMWQKMPFLMLAKCAEALALRKAFPAELSGVYTHEEMMQADLDESVAKPAYSENKKTASAKLNELRLEGAAPNQPGVSESEGHNPLPPPSDAPSPGFIWQIGEKHKGESIVTIPSDYLEWFASNGKRADHVEAAQVELTRREGQMEMEHDDV